MDRDPGLIDISTFSATQRTQLHSFLTTRLKQTLKGLHTPDEDILWQIHAHLVRLISSLYATVPHWTRDDLVFNHSTRSHSGTATILLADVTNFTPLSGYLNTLGPTGSQLLPQILNSFFAPMVALAHAYGGDVLAYGGDAIFVAFTDPDHATIATSVAWKMQQEIGLLTLPPVPGWDGDISLQMKIALASGMLIRASTGTVTRQIPLAFGSILERSDDLAGATKPGGIRLDSLTAQLVGPSAELAEQADGTSLLLGLNQSTSANHIGPSLPQPQHRPIRDLVDQIAAFAGYQPPRLVENLAGAAQGAPGFGEQRRVTTLFIQVSGLHHLADLLGPEQTTTITTAANLVFSAMLEIIEAYGGAIARADVYGDGHKVLAFFGAPIVHEYDSYRAVRAALALRDRLPALTRMVLDLIGQDEPDQTASVLRMRIGINTGSVFAGLIGAPSRYEYTVMGDATNIAARIMSKGQQAHYEVLVSAGIAEQLGNLLDASERQVALKGVADPIQIWSVRQVRADLPQRSARSTPLIGRTGIVQSLRGVALALRRGEPLAMMLQGEAGIGKTRLMAEFKTLLDPAIRQIDIAAPGAVTQSYALIRTLIQLLCAIPADAQPQLIQQQLQHFFQINGNEQVPVWWPALCFLLDLPGYDLGFIGTSSAAQLRALAQATHAAIETATQTSPVAIFCEDLHEVDHESLAILDQTLRIGWRGPLLFAATFRPAYDPLTHTEHPAMNLIKAARAGLRANLTAIVVAELAEEAQRDLLSHLLPNLTPDTRQEIARYTGGNPLFLEVLAEEIQQRAWLRAGNGGLVLRDSLGSLGVPAHVRELVAAQVDQLPFDTRRLACAAAVVAAADSRFPLWLLEEIADDREAVEAQLELLERAQVIILQEDDADGSRWYTFRHTLFQEAAYHLLPEYERRAFHRRIGSALHTFWRSEREERPAILAYHCSEGQLWELAARYSLASGQQAQSAYTTRSAYRWLRQARHLARLHALLQQEADACEGLGALLALRGRFGLARIFITLALRQGATLDASATQLESQARRRRLLGMIGERTGDYQQAEADCRNGLVLAAQIGQPTVEVARLYAQLAEILMRQSLFEAAEQACNQGLESLAQLSSVNQAVLREQAALHYRKATIQGLRGYYREAINDLTQALEQIRHIGDLVLVAAALHNLGMYLALSGDFDLALKRYTESLQIKEQIDDVAGRIQTINNQGIIYSMRGEYTTAFHCFREVSVLCERLNFPDQRGYALINIGIIYFLQQQYTLAATSLQQANQIFVSLGNCLVRPIASTGLVILPWLNTIQRWPCSMEHRHLRSQSRVVALPINPVHYA